MKKTIWYIISKWKENFIYVPWLAHFCNCHISTSISNYNSYRRHSNVSIKPKIGRQAALNSTQIKQLDQTIQQHQSALLLNSYQSHSSILLNSSYNVIVFRLVIVHVSLQLKSRAATYMNKTISICC